LLQGILLTREREDEIKEAVANQRLQTIASLPNLAIFQMKLTILTVRQWKKI